jgi:hypothetical protein
MFPLGEELNEVGSPEAAQVNTGSGSTYASQNREFRAGTRATVQKGAKHSRPRRIADGSGNSGDSLIHSNGCIHSLMICEV